MAIKKRCGFCHKVLRPDGTCGYEKCPRYVPDPKPIEPTETPSTGESVPSEGESVTNTETEPTP